MATDPHKVLRDAVIEAQRILAQHLEPHGPDSEATISMLERVLDEPAVLNAIDATEPSTTGPNNDGSSRVSPLTPTFLS